ncbi:Pectinesterase domain-containing protein [Cephalotus follicularis]|uniref:Pectinesterase n=1 Tax=Cephalotus follicularis TaxID=3775 RepID=A0A1Q3BI93_CEPFO|nr:Pectinesterase domain-containing protein [Cephalotus follicularis]
MCFPSGLAQCKGNWSRVTKDDSEGTYETVVVDQSGNGNFTSIQDAIDYVPSNNRWWFCIYVKAGLYTEKVNIPIDKPYIIMKGEGKRKTLVVSDDHDSTAQSPTLLSSADNIVIKSMGFMNSYNIPGNMSRMAPAVAAMISGDKSAFYRCGFMGIQDTLWDDEGRHYFKKCTIQGAVDFIFGSGQSLYEDCSIQVLGNYLEPGLPGFITAQGRSELGDENGFVFKGCRVFGFGSAYLGRPWRACSRVLFVDSYLTEVVQPEGWDPWHLVGQEEYLVFAEQGNYGPGADTSQRVSWEKQLSMDEVNHLSSMNYIDSEGWLANQPI